MSPSQLRCAGALANSGGRLVADYLDDLAAGKLKAEPNQEKCLQALDELYQQLPAYRQEVNE